MDKIAKNDCLLYIQQRKALTYKNTYIHFKTFIICVKNIHSLMYIRTILGPNKL